jgi:glycosyltransferase involved in cell wall biosynthesis
MIKDKDIIIVGLQPWENEIGSNCKNIAIEFAKYNSVLYVNHPLDRNTLLKKSAAEYQKHLDIIKNKKENLIQVDKNIWALYPKAILESANWIPVTSIFRTINKINNQRFSKDIQQAVEKLNFKNYLLFNDSDMFRSFHLKEMLKPAVSIYYTRDNLMGVPYWFKHGSIIEPELFKKSDLVVANSIYLANVAHKYNKNSYYVGQGCDVHDFDKRKVKGPPADMALIKPPIIGYIGALYDLRLDISLLEELARQEKGWSFAFIGPEDDAFKNSKLHELQNVHFLGLKEMKDLPAYLAQFDIAINPQRINEVTIGNYPRKIDEYLAMGKAVVATKTEAMSIFEGYVYFASNVQEYSEQIRRAILENTAQKEEERITYACSHTWENSVAEIYEAILKVKPELQYSQKECV